MQKGWTNRRSSRAFIESDVFAVFGYWQIKKKPVPILNMKERGHLGIVAHYAFSSNIREIWWRVEF